MSRLIAFILVVTVFGGETASAKGICNFLVKQPRSATVSGVIVGGPWKSNSEGGYKYSMTLEDAAEGSCGLDAGTEVSIYTNQSLAKCKPGGSATATGRGEPGWMYPGIPVYDMKQAKVKCP